MYFYLTMRATNQVSQFSHILCAGRSLPYSPSTALLRREMGYLGSQAHDSAGLILDLIHCKAPFGLRRHVAEGH